jgi:hypothetical protein
MTGILIAIAFLMGGWIVHESDQDGQVLEEGEAI